MLISRQKSIFCSLDPVAKSADSAFSALDWAIQNTDQEVFHLLVSHMKDGPLRSLVQLAFCATVEEEEGEPSNQFKTLLNQLNPTQVESPQKLFKLCNIFFCRLGMINQQQNCSLFASRLVKPRLYPKFEKE